MRPTLRRSVRIDHSPVDRRAGKVHAEEALLAAHDRSHGAVQELRPLAHLRRDQHLVNVGFLFLPEIARADDFGVEIADVGVKAGERHAGGVQLLCERGDERGRAGDAPRLLDQPPGRIGAEGDARHGPIEPVPDRRRFELHCPVPSLRVLLQLGSAGDRRKRTGIRRPSRAVQDIVMLNRLLLPMALEGARPAHLGGGDAAPPRPDPIEVIGLATKPSRGGLASAPITCHSRRTGSGNRARARHFCGGTPAAKTSLSQAGGRRR